MTQQTGVGDAVHPRFAAAIFTVLTGADFLHLIYARAQRVAQG